MRTERKRQREREANRDGQRGWIRSRTWTQGERDRKEIREKGTNTESERSEQIDQDRKKMHEVSRSTCRRSEKHQLQQCNGRVEEQKINEGGDGIKKGEGGKRGKRMIGRRGYEEVGREVQTLHTGATIETSCLSFGV